MMVANGGLQAVAVSAALVAIRLSGLMLFAPVLSSAAVAPRIKAGLVGAMTLLMAPAVSAMQQAVTEVTLSGVLGELSVGLVMGLSVSLLMEMLNFAGALLSMEFSFSLVNLVDPNSMVETPVLGQMLGWVGVLVLLGAGLHRTLLTAMLGSFTAVPAGHAVLAAKSGPALAHMASGIFTAGVQLAAPVIAAAMAVEVTVGLVARLAPQLPAMVLSVPLKTMVSYVVMIGSLAIWPGFLERHFDSLLAAAKAMLAVG